MKTDEVIKRLNESIKAYEYEKKHSLVKMDKAWDDTIEVCKIAIQSLEKQIPKKPHIPNAGLEIDFAQCDCGGFLVSYFGGMYKYCKDCGQAVDWSKDHD